jgi:hypothetical protein
MLARTDSTVKATTPRKREMVERRLIEEVLLTLVSFFHRRNSL